jgi:hypothetical protein
MALTPVFPAIQATHAFEISPSDTDDIELDAANIDEVKAVFIHNPAAGGEVKVLPAGMSPDDDPVTIYIAQGATFPMAVRRIYATSPTPPSGLIALYSKQR